MTLAVVTDPVTWLVVIAVVVATFVSPWIDHVTDRDMRTLERRRAFIAGLTAIVSRHRTPGEPVTGPSPGP